VPKQPRPPLRPQKGGAAIIPLTADLLNMLFESVYGVTPETEQFLRQNTWARPIFDAIIARQQWLYANDINRYPMYERVEPILGPFQINSDGTTLWLAMCQALQDLYRLTDDELCLALSRVSVRK